MKLRSILFPALGCLASAVTAHAQLTLNQIGGPITSGNYGALSGTQAFGLDEILGGTLSIHKIPNIRDNTFGNPNSWIGDSLNSFVGLNFGATPLPVGQIAWGRDNLGSFGDRTQGVYDVHYTQVANPGAALAVTGNPATGWASIGSVNYLFQDTVGSKISMSLRHLWSFPSVNATGIRLTAPGSGAPSGAAIDELEAYAYAPPPVSLITTGGTMALGNIALTSTAFGKDIINNGGFPAHDSIGNINDGLYGNENSWIGNSESSFVGLNFNGSQTINRFAFGRDNTGAFGDRSGGTYMLQYTTIPGPNETTPDGDWTTIGSVYYDHNGLDSADRHEYSFDPVTATGVRLIVAGNGIGTGLDIDELEIYAIPEPATMSLAALGAIALRRRRRA